MGQVCREGKEINMVNERLKELYEQLWETQRQQEAIEEEIQKEFDNTPIPQRLPEPNFSQVILECGELIERLSTKNLSKLWLANYEKIIFYDALIAVYGEAARDYVHLAINANTILDEGE